MTTPILPGPTLLRMGSTVTVLKTATGGAIGSTVASENGEHDRKHLGPVFYEDLVLTMTVPPASKALRDWITEAFTDRRTPASGEVVGTNADRTVFTARRFTDAFISSIEFPAMEAGETTQGELIVHLAPSALSVAAGGDRAAALPAQPRWRSGDFALNIAGLDGAGVVRIDTFTVELPIGSALDRSGEPVPMPLQGPPDLPVLEVQIAADKAGSWIEWHEDFVIKGNNGPAAERSGTLQLLSANRTKILANIALEGLGIAKLTWPDLGTGDAAPTLTAELYAERMSILW